MIRQVADMARDVRVAVDMNRMSDRMYMEKDADTLSFDGIVRSKLVDAVRLVEMEAPVGLLEHGHTFRGAVSWRGDSGKGYILLPDDFMRLVYFKMSDWDFGVSEAMTDASPLYLRQFSKWKGVSGNTERPVAAVVNRAEGLVLEFFSGADDTATVDQAAYVPYPRVDKDGGIDVSERCYPAAVYRAAALALSSVNDGLATTMLDISKSLLS